MENFKDVFGFEKNQKQTLNAVQNEDPSHPIDVEWLFEYLGQHDIGPLKPNEVFFNEIKWGIDTGSIRVKTGSNLSLMIERLGIDLIGRPRWVLKRLYQMNRSGDGVDEGKLANQILDKINEISEQQIESPKNDWNDLEGYVSYIASKLKQNARDIFIFEGIKKNSDYDYIIRMAVRGQGVEAPSQQRVVENQTRLTYNPAHGLIRLTNYNIESPIKGHNWVIMPSDVDAFFFPTQSREEIAETVSTYLHWY